MSISVEEKAVEILADDVKGNCSRYLSKDKFETAFSAACATIRAMSSKDEYDNTLFVEPSKAYNEYLFLVLPDEMLEARGEAYLNVFNHSSKL